MRNGVHGTPYAFRLKMKLLWSGTWIILFARASLNVLCVRFAAR